MRTLSKTYDFQEHSIIVIASQYDHDSRWTIQISVVTPDGKTLPVIDDAETSYDTVDEAYSAGFSGGKICATLRDVMPNPSFHRTLRDKAAQRR